MHYTLRQLEVFLATARFQNISRAAESLSMSQSAASGALQDLERQFDIRLFDRAGKRLQLNDLGRALQPQALALLDQAQALEAGFAGRADTGALNIGATLTIGNYLAVGLMANFMNEHPGVRVALTVDNTAHIAAGVAGFNLDLGLVEGELSHPELVITPWREDELIAFCAPDHVLAKRYRLNDDDLLAATWILREPGSGTRQTFDRALHGLLPRLNILLELQHTEAIKRAVEAGLGIGCLSRITLRDAFQRGSLVALDMPHRDLRRHFYFVLHRRKFISPGMERWLELCRASSNDVPT